MKLYSLPRALKNARLLQQDITITSAFLLIFLDLLKPGSDKENFHREGIKWLIAQLPPSQAPRMTASQGMETTIQGLRGFTLRQIYLCDRHARSDLYTSPDTICLEISATASPS
ncbi:hypothetical protein BBP40_011389 [Aspergillus hancockii]|nr:hypothetical protein BBP40_011389 [Aspergillus hancockii]